MRSPQAFPDLLPPSPACRIPGTQLYLTPFSRDASSPSPPGLWRSPSPLVFGHTEQCPAHSRAQWSNCFPRALASVWGTCRAELGQGENDASCSITSVLSPSQGVCVCAPLLGVGQAERGGEEVSVVQGPLD